MQGNDKKSKLQKVNSAMMRNDKVDVQVVIKLSNISDEKYTYPLGSQSVMRRWEYKSIITTSLNWVTSSRDTVRRRKCSRTQCDAGGADYVKMRSSCLRS